MRKSLVICCDGTWSSHDDPNPTNVFRLRNLLRATAGSAPQAVYYDTGVGTAGSWPRRAWDGATGSGISTNVCQAYRALIDNYHEGDQIYLFGFSRGAYTVRSLAGLIRNCGVLRRDCKSSVSEAYRFYRSRNSSKAPRQRSAAEFRAKYAVEDVTPIHFIGVWDTVGSLGNPLLRHNHPLSRERFHDVRLSSIVRHAYQALAIDEHRSQFRPAVWRQQTHALSQEMVQAWFVGAHSDVGGGYPESGLSHLSLRWMLSKAVEAGLAIDKDAFERILGSPEPQWMQIPHESHRGFYAWFPAYERKIEAPPAAGNESLPSNERLHWTVIARYKQDLGYRPSNLMKFIESHGDLLDGDPEENHLLERP